MTKNEAFGHKSKPQSKFTQAMQKFVNTMDRMSDKKKKKLVIKEEDKDKPPIRLRTQTYNDRHLKRVSKQTKVKVKGLRQMIKNFNSAKLPWDRDIKEDAPTNSMGQSSSATGPIQTVDPLLKRKSPKKLRAVLKRN